MASLQASLASCILWFVREYGNTIKVKVQAESIQARCTSCTETLSIEVGVCDYPVYQEIWDATLIVVDS